jgi:hypothetical protein
MVLRAFPLIPLPIKEAMAMQRRRVGVVEAVSINSTSYKRSDVFFDFTD